MHFRVEMPFGAVELKGDIEKMTPANGHGDVELQVDVAHSPVLAGSRIIIVMPQEELRQFGVQFTRYVKPA